MPRKHGPTRAASNPPSTRSSRFFRARAICARISASPPGPDPAARSRRESPKRSAIAAPHAAPARPRNETAKAGSANRDRGTVNPPASGCGCRARSAHENPCPACRARTHPLSPACSTRPRNSTRLSRSPGRVSGSVMHSAAWRPRHPLQRLPHHQQLLEIIHRERNDAHARERRPLPPAAAPPRSAPPRAAARARPQARPQAPARKADPPGPHRAREDRRLELLHRTVNERPRVPATPEASSLIRLAPASLRPSRLHEPRAPSRPAPVDNPSILPTICRPSTLASTLAVHTGRPNRTTPLPPGSARRAGSPSRKSSAGRHQPATHGATMQQVPGINPRSWHFFPSSPISPTPSSARRSSPPGRTSGR